MTMTLDQLRDEMMCTTSTKAMEFYLHDRWPAAIDAHIAGMGEAAGHQYRRRMIGAPNGWSDWYYLHPENYDSAIGTDGAEVRPLFTAPPIDIDIAAVREVIVEMTRLSQYGGGIDLDVHDMCVECGHLADELTAALTKKTP